MSFCDLSFLSLGWQCCVILQAPPKSSAISHEYIIWQANPDHCQPWLAASVESVTHRCHLTPPNIFSELPRTPFSSQTLSIDPRTICLVRLAVRNMTRVNTLRLVFGHPKLTEALLRCFFDENRKRENPIKRLWLDNVRIVEALPIYRACRLDKYPRSARQARDRYRHSRHS